MTALGAGWVTIGRRGLFKVYGPSVPAIADESLKGSTLGLMGFVCAPVLVEPESKSKPEEPIPFKYTDLTREQDKLSAKEMKALQKQTTRQS